MAHKREMSFNNHKKLSNPLPIPPDGYWFIVIAAATYLVTGSSDWETYGNTSGKITRLLIRLKTI